MEFFYIICANKILQLYAGLFLFGLCGNVSVITLIRQVHSSVPYDNTMIFILFLCCVDLASVLPLPMAIVDQLLGFWVFGTVCCKIYRMLEHVGRALSTFILAAMAFDRFQRVWYPHRKTRWVLFFNSNSCLIISKIIDFGKINS